MGNEIKIMKYDPNWKRTFEQEKGLISTFLGEEAKAIEHVGSTSILNQEAKPVVDIFAGVKPFKELTFYKSVFDTGIYDYVQTGMSKRYLFSKYTDGTWTHNIHIMPFDDEFYLRNELLFRDYLRRHPDLVQEYGKVKKKAKMDAKNQGNNREKAYTRSKTEFVQRVVDAARNEQGLPWENVWEE